MKKLIKIREDLDYIPWIIRLLLTIFLDGLYGGIYRFTKGSVFGIITGVLWLAVSYLPLIILGPFGTVFLGVLTLTDIISVAFFGKIKVLV